MSNPQRDKDVEMVKQHLVQLGEFFDSVHVFCTRHEQGESGGTNVVQMGCGNWYARFGQISEWLEKEKETARCETRKSNVQP